MPRPSLKETRSEEILDAFMRCVARYGLDGSTLALISEEAGVGRPLLRHYLGNRDQMVVRLLDHVMAKFDRMTRELFDTLPETKRLEALIDTLFERTNHSSDNAAVYQALVAASERYGDIREPLLHFTVDFENRIAAEILQDNTTADPEAAQVAAAGVAAIYFNTDAVTPLDPGAAWVGRQRRAAEALLRSVSTRP